jgi:hypothetical protein
MEELFYITECCGGPMVEGCESMTEAQVDEWMSINNEVLEVAAECGDTVKYVRIPVGQSHEPIEPTESND